MIKHQQSMPVNRNGDNMLDRLDTDGNSLMSK